MKNLEWKKTKVVEIAEERETARRTWILLSIFPACSPRCGEAVFTYFEQIRPLKLTQEQKCKMVADPEPDCISRNGQLWSESIGDTVLKINIHVWAGCAC